jgi:glutamate synthase (NADPH) large chain
MTRETPRTAAWKPATPMIAAPSATPAASAWSPRSTASAAPRVVESAIDALKAVWHRGAVDADGKTGDGAGIHIDLPHRFFDDARRRQSATRCAQPPRRRHDLPAAHRSRRAGDVPHDRREPRSSRPASTIYGWRQVPVDVSVIGMKAQAPRGPRSNRSCSPVRCRTTWPANSSANLYLSVAGSKSASSPRRSSRLLHLFAVVPLDRLQGHVPRRDLSVFYPDLQDQRFESRVAIFHQRYSTNTFPQWWLAQPFRMLAHNGEINTFAATRTG